MTKNTNAIVKGLYPKVESSMKKNLNKFKGCMARFIEKRSRELYDICPADRIYYGEEDSRDLFESLGITEDEIRAIIQKTYYYQIAAFNPRAAKDEVTVLMMMVIRYFHKVKMQKELELSAIYLAFSGKFYPSVHYSSYPKAAPTEYRHIMEYVVNNMLTNKFDLKIHGSILGAIKSMCLTWLDKYEKMLNTSDDEDIVYMVQQLHDRIKAFTQNIASLYYEAYKNKDVYITYDSDNLDADSYRLADNDSLKAERIVEKSVEKLNTISVDYKLCKMCSDSNIKTDEIKSIIEIIVSDKDNVIEVKELIRLLTITYYETSKNKDVRDIDFITFSISAKPNTKDKNIIRIKEIIEGWLLETSPAYRKRRSRLATKNSYNRAILLYFTLLIHTANK